MKPNCYQCKHRTGIPGDAHSECKHPAVNDCDRVVAPIALNTGIRSQALKRLNVSGNPHGIKNGWFFWPINFDPVWLETCDGFEPKGGEQGETNK